MQVFIFLRPTRCFRLGRNMRVLWFKRDLRVEDHLPLFRCARRGPVLPIYIYEPRIIHSPEYGANQHAFIEDSLEELDASLRRLGGRLIRLRGHARDVLEAIHAMRPITELHSHMETGTGLTYRRDKAVAAWCRAHDVTWSESPTSDVQRPHRERDGWSRRWYQATRSPIVPTPDRIEVPRMGVPQSVGPCGSEMLGIGLSAPLVQKGGRSRGLALLKRFLREDPAAYPSKMSSPNTADTACSRLSPHLALGTLSTREVIHRLDGAKRLVTQPSMRKGYDAFESRLAWRGHFMQRLEDEMRIETLCLDPSTEHIRKAGARWMATRLTETEIQRRLQAWKDGCTGYPMVDACMRSLRKTGWLSFRMRAMVVSVACYTLWLDWRVVNSWLARQFTDYEPGIHLNQLQMQSGSTGMNELRIYNPVRQAEVHDPEGAFIRTWVPELADVPTQVIHALGNARSTEIIEHWTLSYPAPIVAHGLSARFARVTLLRCRKTPESRQAAQQSNQRLGSRKPRPPRSRG